ncbi:MAG: tetratricopeptide repeat protein [Deltaproteobacteria bacterium]|nr:tetratricopeptide repeat protein [Deltaproteobacteria bacterium]
MKKLSLLVSLILTFSFLAVSCAPVQQVDKTKEAEAHYMLGISYLKEQNFTHALKEFLTAEEFDARRLDIQEGIALAYQLKQAYPEAEKYYLKALKIDPKEPRIASNLATLYLDMREWDKAIRYFEEASNNILFDQPEKALLGIGFAHFKKQDYQKAKLYYEKALEKKWNFAPAYFRLGELFLAQDKVTLAQQNFEKAIDLNPNYVTAYFQLALTQMKAKDFNKARESFRKVILLTPESEIAVRAGELMKVLPENE